MTKAKDQQVEQQLPPIDEPAEQAQAPKQELSINDLQSLRAIIDLASSRGAFKPAEMMAIGQVYTKLSSFLDAVTK